MSYQVKLLSSLDKVFPSVTPVERPEVNKLTGMRNETLSFQIAYTGGAPGVDWGNPFVTVAVDSPIAKYIKVRQVKLVPAQMPVGEEHDGDYLTSTPGLLPDLLSELSEHSIRVIKGQWHSLWVDIEPGDDLLPAGIHPIKISFMDSSGAEVCHKRTNVEIFDAVLPKQEIIYTQWFHADCLADYYNVEAFGEKHWEITESFIKTAVARGINMLLTPAFTPPLDTAPGHERTTVQLVDVFLKSGVYSFNFDKLKRWVDTCLRLGVRYFEMAHLFTQWGAKCAPKVMATVDGACKRLFGWDTPATSEEYGHFLSQYLPALTQALKSWGVADKVYFHISDEPSAKNIDSYAAAKKMVEGYLKGFTIIDALSDYRFYAEGIVEKPIPSNSHIKPFIENGVPGLWTYYCCAQEVSVSNRFMAQPSARNRIIGTQFYKFNIEGMLQWGYNFYNSQYSYTHINPYVTTDVGGGFPSGDAFSVYPGADGKPEESIRLMVFAKALDDVRAFKLLESLTNKNFVMELIESDLAEPITFDTYPKSDFYLISLRNRVNREIAKRLDNTNR